MSGKIKRFVRSFSGVSYSRYHCPRPVRRWRHRVCCNVLPQAFLCGATVVCMCEDVPA